MKNVIYFSASTCGFYHSGAMSDYILRGTFPDDAVEMTEEEISLFYMVTPPAGKALGSSSDRPAWADIPPPTHEELVAAAEREKQLRIATANDFMSSKQWPGKAAIGRLKGEELVQYNLWLDYLDALDAVDTSSAPDITWPAPPEA
ncbi:tail fiber assembly protein [Salmonella enterica]|nr:tail fiber assembly protein [Salmonella enterica]EBS1537261.1 tail fiber assembly protein [Salmonella enterica subsp. enterica serovar Emek]ELN1631122.1 tail fiber assembly protein [Salmonella enterica]